mmetsp:Transcript_10190/g.15408  ORF Transcript_10190/g.15408 Transcript_10190/m.15408 type:complete len:365 (+) Transcript_10190:93-1187(+)
MQNIISISLLLSVLYVGLIDAYGGGPPIASKNNDCPVGFSEEYDLSKWSITQNGNSSSFSFDDLGDSLSMKVSNDGTSTSLDGESIMYTIQVQKSGYFSFDFEYTTDQEAFPLPPDLPDLADGELTDEELNGLIPSGLDVIDTSSTPFQVIIGENEKILTDVKEDPNFQSGEGLLFAVKEGEIIGFKIASATIGYIAEVKITNFKSPCNEPADDKNLCNGTSGFFGYYDLPHWNITVEGDSSYDFNPDEPSMLMKVSADDNLDTDVDTEQEVTFTIEAPNNGTLSFDWEYSTEEFDGRGPDKDPFSVIIGDDVHVLTENNSTSGTFSREEIFANQVIGFNLKSEDSRAGSANIKITNFNAPCPA